jgi:hypothetical protein
MVQARDAPSPGRFMFAAGRPDELAATFKAQV